MVKFILIMWILVSHTYYKPIYHYTLGSNIHTITSDVVLFTTPNLYIRKLVLITKLKEPANLNVQIQW